MRNNNGKIAIAIVAMFVVALSIVGVTYAYFTANIVGNNSDSSVKITAGNLEVTYTHGTTMTATNIVPGWKSDGLHYYDADSATGQIVAKSVDDKESADIQGKTSADGVVLPTSFSVKSTGDSTNDAFFIIKLVNITNGFEDGEINDTENLKVTVYKGTYDDDYKVDNDTIVYETTKLNKSTNDQIVVNKVQKLTQGETANYYAMLEYTNTQSDQSLNMGRQVSATVQIVGVAQNGSKWYTATGTEVSGVQNPEE